MDDELGTLLSAKFNSIKSKLKSMINPLLDVLGLLSAYSFKIRIGYTLDLIQKWMYDDLEIIRRLRNKAAHIIEPSLFADSVLEK